MLDGAIVNDKLDPNASPSTTARKRLYRLALRYELPTWLVTFVIYGGWLALTLNYHSLPWWLVLLLGAVLTCWHGSLQHEVIHGHPTRQPRVNRLLALPPLGLWLPWSRYDKCHRLHHTTLNLTDPVLDPESWLVDPATWERSGRGGRAVLWILNTLAGRFLLGPAVAAWRTWRADWRLVRAGDHEVLADWIEHAVAVVVLVIWVVGVCDIPFLAYVALFAYPGQSLTLLRSFIEHQPGDVNDRRTNIILASAPMRWLYLNNNFHVLHHENPRLSWYRLPRRFRRHRRSLIDRAGRVFRHGYLEIIARYLVRPVWSPTGPG